VPENVIIPDGLMLNGKVALISGASSGIGRATARTLAAVGARVCLVARDGKRLDAAVAELKEHGLSAIGVAGDAQEAATRERSVRACIDELGGLDILVNTVGGAGPRRTIAEMDEATIRDLSRLNVETALLFSQLAWREWQPGDVLFADDIGSKGHRVKDVGEEHFVTVQLAMSADWDWPSTLALPR
jgi:NAD(P)-dependent dehydrogenase (short-subunit alcohol dehydrogenase family)